MSLWSALSRHRPVRGYGGDHPRGARTDRWLVVWDGASPALLVGGGSGVVPLMAMLRLARNTGRSHLLRVVVSVRTPADLYYADELPGPETTVVHTRQAPPGDARPPGRLTVSDLPPDAAELPLAYICGSAAFAEHAPRS